MIISRRKQKPQHHHRHYFFVLVTFLISILVLGTLPSFSCASSPWSWRRARGGGRGFPRGDNTDDGEQRPYRPQHSFRAPFLFGRSTTIPFWDYGGSAVATEDYLRLVPDMGSRTGYAWNVMASNMIGWEVEMEFRIHNGKGLGADGMAMWYTKDRMTEGSLYGNTADFEGLGIVFDTYDNDGQRDNPRVIGILGQGPNAVWDQQEDLTNKQLASCYANLRNTPDNVVAKITYHQRTLDVSIDTEGDGNFEHCFTRGDVDLPAGYYFGVTAATGGLGDNHDVLRFEVKQLEAAPPEQHHDAAPDTKQENPSPRRKPTDSNMDRNDPPSTDPQNTPPPPPPPHHQQQQQQPPQYQQQQPPQQQQQPPPQHQYQPPQHQQQQQQQQQQPPQYQQQPPPQHQYHQPQQHQPPPPDYGKDIDHLTQRVQSLQDSLHGMERRMKGVASESRVDSLAKEINEVQDMPEAMNNRIDQVKSELSRSNTESVNRLKQSQRELRRSIEGVESSVRGLENKINDVVSRLDAQEAQSQEGMGVWSWIGIIAGLGILGVVGAVVKGVRDKQREKKLF